VLSSEFARNGANSPYARLTRWATRFALGYDSCKGLTGSASAWHFFVHEGVCLRDEGVARLNVGVFARAPELGQIRSTQISPV